MGYQALGDDVSAGRAAAACGTALGHAAGGVSRALALLVPYWGSLQDRADATESLLMLARVLGMIYRQAGRYADAQRVVETRIRLAQAVGHDDDLVDALNVLGVGYLQTGAPYLGSLLARAAADLARQRALPTALARALSNLSTDAMTSDVPAAVQLATEGVAAAQKSGSSDMIAFTTVNAASARWTTGRWAEIDALLQERARRRHPRGARGGRVRSLGEARADRRR